MLVKYLLVYEAKKRGYSELEINSILSQKSNKVVLLFYDVILSLVIPLLLSVTVLISTHNFVYPILFFILLFVFFSIYPFSNCDFMKKIAKKLSIIFLALLIVSILILLRTHLGFSTYLFVFSVASLVIVSYPLLQGLISKFNKKKTANFIESFGFYKKSEEEEKKEESDKPKEQPKQKKEPIKKTPKKGENKKPPTKPNSQKKVKKNVK